MPKQKRKVKDLFKLKTSKEKLHEQIKKKKEKLIKLNKKPNKNSKKIKKLEEELIKMAKIELKDGKLQKIEDVEVVPETLPPLSEAPVPQGQPVEQPYRQQMRQPMPEPVQQYQQPAPQQYQQPAPQQYQQPAPQQYQQPEPEPVQQYQQPQNPFQEMQRQNYGAPRQPESIPIYIRLTEDEEINVVIPVSEIDNFLNALAEAIATNTVLQVGNDIISGRHIIFYRYG